MPHLCNHSSIPCVSVCFKFMLINSTGCVCHRPRRQSQLLQTSSQFFVFNTLPYTVHVSYRCITFASDVTWRNLSTVLYLQNGWKSALKSACTLRKNLLPCSVALYSYPCGSQKVALRALSHLHVEEGFRPAPMSLSTLQSERTIWNSPFWRVPMYLPSQTRSSPQ